MNQTAGSGTSPSVGRLARSQPQISPAINTPPLTVRLSGTLPIRVTNAHPKISPPRKIPIPTSVMLLFSVGASLNPISSAARSTSCRSPTSSIRSPASSLPPPSTGICTFARRIERIDTPCMYFSFSRARTVLPATPFLLTTTGSVSTEKLTSSLSSTSRPIHVSSSMTNRRRPLTTISSPRRMTVFGEGSLTDPCCRRRSTKILFCCPAMYCSNSRTVRPGSNHSLSALKARKTIVRAAGSNPGLRLMSSPICDSICLAACFTFATPPSSLGPRVPSTQADPAVP